MSGLEPKPTDALPEDVVRLLNFERAASEPPPEMAARVLERLGQSALRVPVGGLAKSALTAKLATVAVISASLGGAVGTTLYAQWRPPQVQYIEVPVIQTVEVPMPVAPQNEVAAPPPPAPTPQKIVVTKKAPVPTDAPVEVPLSRDQALAAERALVEQARTSLARQHPEEALAALAEHRQRFPHGQLEEEREGLDVLSLFASGSVQEGRAAAAQFRQQFPKSVFLRSIKLAEAAAAPSPK
jgi:hypothetical protein